MNLNLRLRFLSLDLLELVKEAITDDTKIQSKVLYKMITKDDLDEHYRNVMTNTLICGRVTFSLQENKKMFWQDIAYRNFFTFF